MSGLGYEDLGCDWMKVRELAAAAALGPSGFAGMRAQLGNKNVCIFTCRAPVHVHIFGLHGLEPTIATRDVLGMSKATLSGVGIGWTVVFSAGSRVRGFWLCL